MNFISKQEKFDLFSLMLDSKIKDDSGKLGDFTVGGSMLESFV